MSSAAQRGPRPPWRPAASRRLVAAGVGVLLLGAGVVGWAVTREQEDSSRASRAGAVPGVPLQGPSGLRLLVANGATAFVLEVDTGAIQPVTGLPAGADRSTHVEPVGQDAVVVSRRDCRGSGRDPDSVALWFGTARPRRPGSVPPLTSSPPATVGAFGWSPGRTRPASRGSRPAR